MKGDHQTPRPAGDDEPLAPGSSGGRREWWALLAIVMIGLGLRTVRLGELSFSGDEETTTLAALALLDGWPPTLPGGTVYLRGLPFTVLEAASIAVFGVSEWALRLVPVLAAGPRILAMWWLARPLLGPALALACAALLAVAPLDVEYSRTARMYSLFATLDLAFVAAIVHAACSGRHLLSGGVLGMAGVITHDVGVTHAPVAWVAAAGRGLSARVRIGLLAAGAAVVATYIVLLPVVMAGYFVPVTGRSEGGLLPEALASYASGAASVLSDSISVGIVATGAALALAFAVPVIRNLGVPLARLAAVGSLVTYALGSPVLGTTLWLGILMLEGLGPRAGLRRTAPMLAVAGATTLAWTVAATRLSGTHIEGIESALRLLLSLPAPNWFFFARAAPVLFTLACLGLLAAAERSAGSGRSGAWLALVVAALGPALIGGLVLGRGALRYQLHALGPLIILAILGGEALLRSFRIPSRLRPGLAVLVVALAIRPDLSAQAVFREHGPISSPFAVLNVAPDHRGAAEFLRTRLQPDEWLAAEDPLQQHLYLGRADVWLRRIDDAGQFIREDPMDGAIRDVYTGSLHANGIEDLRLLARQHEKRVIWLVTSGECEALPDYYRTPELAALLERWRPLAWFEGEDGMTRVYRLVDGEPVAPAS